MEQDLRTIEEVEWGCKSRLMKWRYVFIDGSKTNWKISAIEFDSPFFRAYQRKIEMVVGYTIPVQQSDLSVESLPVLPSSFQDALSPNKNSDDQPAGGKPAPAEYYLGRLRHLLEKQVQHADDKQGLILIQIGINSTYKACQKHGVGDEAKKMLREFGIDPEARPEPKSTS